MSETKSASKSETTKSASKSETWIKLLNEGILKSKTIVVLDYISKFPNTNLYAMRNGLP